MKFTLKSISNVISYIFANLLLITIWISSVFSLETRAQSNLSEDVLRFVKLNANGVPLIDQNLSYDKSSWSCVKDNTTHLIWEIKTNDGSFRDQHNTYTYNINKKIVTERISDISCKANPCDVLSYLSWINKIKLCGANDWRVPSREELRSIVNYHTAYPGPTIYKKFFPNTASQFYWSSTADASEVGSNWGIGFAFGYDYSYDKSARVSLRLVRGKPLLINDASNLHECRNNDSSIKDREFRFIENNDSSVTDKITGLTWMRCAVGQHWTGNTCLGEATKMSRMAAIDLVATNMEFKGKWLLPTLQQLSTIVENKCFNPALTLSIFSSTPAANFWSSTPFANPGNFYWQINFQYGENTIGGSDDLAYVRLIKTPEH